MSTSIPMQLAIAANSLRPCIARGCPFPRHRMESACSKHVDASRRYGHPSAKPIKRSSWAPYRVAVRDLFSRNASHPGLVHGLQFLDTFMAQGAARADAYFGATEVRRLCAAGITARDVLEVLCAVSHWSVDHPMALPSDKAIDYAISRAVIQLAPRPRKTSWASGRAKTYAGRPNHSAVRFLGGHLRVNLAALTVQARLGVEAMQALKNRTAEEVEAARRAPFVTG